MGTIMDKKTKTKEIDIHAHVQLVILKKIIKANNPQQTKEFNHD